LQQPLGVIAGLDPAIPLTRAQQLNRDARDKPAHDRNSKWHVISIIAISRPVARSASSALVS
jgi:hypothetical protein